MDSKILDASAFYAGVPFGADDNWFTTAMILEEVKHIKKNHDTLNTMVGTGRLCIRDPIQRSIIQAKKASKKTGDYWQLSRQDISVLALGIEMGGQIVTDDFAVSNVARSLGITVRPVMTNGIKNAGVWIYYCPACKKNFRDKKECPLCGTDLRRKLLRSGSKKGQTS